MNENMSFTVFLNLILTGVIYEAVPIFMKVILKDDYTEQEAKKIAIYNSVAVYVLFSIWHLFFLKDDTIANFAPAVTWGWLSYYILKPKKNVESLSNDKQIETQSISKDEELKQVLMQLKKEEK